MPSAAYSVVVIRIVPAGFSRRSRTAASSASISSLRRACARLRRRDAAGGARQQPHTEARLEFANGVAERGLRHAELGCRLREAAFPPDREERHKVIQVAALHLSSPAISPFGL